MILEFAEMKQAKAFVTRVKKRFDVDGQAYDDKNAAQVHDAKMGHAPLGHASFPLFPLVPPVALIDRVGVEHDDDVAEAKQRFDLTDKFLDEVRDRHCGRIRFYETHSEPNEHYKEPEPRILMSVAAEARIERLAREFGGEFIST
jgi:hypothetical protein